VGCLVLVPVSDVRSNPNDQIAHAANVLKRSERLRVVFETICRGGKRPKTVAQLIRATGYDQVAILQLGGKLTDQQLVHKIRNHGKTLYEKDRFYAANRVKIIRLATNPAKLKNLPTKYAPRTPSYSGTMKVRVTGAKIQIGELTCDDFDQFSRVKKIKGAGPKKISESRFKKGIAKLIGETGTFQDWGGEPNDLYTSKLKYKGKRCSVAFAFKGPGTTGVLTPKKLGKNGDQIQRLFLSPADIFIVQYHSQIGQSVIEQMKAFATLNSVREGKHIWYGVIDGDDTNRLLAAYPRQFGFQ
jgi:hypothetical protein